MTASEPTTAQLIAQALSNDQDADAWSAAVWSLQRRASPEDFAAAAQLCRSTLAVERQLGADILGQLGYDANFPFQVRAAPILISLLADPVDSVAASAGAGLGHQRIAAAIPALVRAAGHASEAVRRGAVHGLSVHDDPAAVRALITLSADPVDHIRDWATFGLGTLLSTDTPELRSALCARLADADVDTRDEAIAGLAARQDPRAIAALVDALSGATASDLILKTAADIDDPRVRAALAAFGPPEEQ